MWELFRAVRKPDEMKNAPRRCTVGFALILVLSMLVAACGGAGSSTVGSSGTSEAGTSRHDSSSTTTATPPPDGGTETTTEPTAPPTKLVLGQVSGLMENIFHFLGVEKGFFKDEGIELELVDIKEGGTINKAILAGELDIGETGIGPLLQAISQGAELRLIGIARPKLNFLVYARSDIDSLEDLQGKSIGTAAPGSQLHVSALAVFQTKGIDTSKMEFVNIGASPAVYQAVVGGKVDAGVATFDWSRLAEQNPDVKVLIDMAPELPLFLRSGLATRTKLVEENPESLVAFLRALSKSIRYGIENPDEFVELAVKLQNRDPEEVRWALEYTVKNRIVNPELTVDPEGIRYLQELNMMIGSQEKILPFDELVDDRLQKQMMDELGSFAWPN